MISLQNLNIEHGDIVLVHSDLRRLMRRVRLRSDRQMVSKNLVAELEHQLGPEGTLVFPVFTFDFCKTGRVSHLDQDCETGYLAKYVLNRNSGARSFSPVYSFTAIGKYSDQINSMVDLDPFCSKSSVFSLLESLGCKLLVIGLEDNNALTYVHYVERMHSVPYRIDKSFDGIVKRADGSYLECSTRLFVRRDSHVETDISLLQKLLINEGKYQCFGDARSISMSDYHSCASNLLMAKKYEFFHRQLTAL